MFLRILIKISKERSSTSFNVAKAKRETSEWSEDIVSPILKDIGGKGCSISLTHLAPYVRMSYNEYLNKYKDWGIDEPHARDFANRDIRKEIRDAVQTFNYQINSMSTTNGQ